MFAKVAATTIITENPEVKAEVMKIKVIKATVVETEALQAEAL